MDPEAFALALCRSVRAQILPLVGSPEARVRAGTAVGGDPTYAIDEAAESAAARLFEARGNLAYYTEDAGLRVLGTPEALYLLDPVDGSRPAVAGYESCGVSVAVAPYGEDLTVRDVTFGCVMEIPGGASFQARRGSGAVADGAAVRPSSASGLDGLFWAGGFRGQPAVETVTALRDLFEGAGAEGAFFDQGSAAYSLTRVATGQLDAYVDVGQTLVDEVPGMERSFRRAGGGHVLNTTTYDTAAGYLVLRELGLPVTDARGRPVDDIPLFDAEGRSTLVSTVAACTPDLHGAVLAAVDAGIDRLRARVGSGPREPG